MKYLTRKEELILLTVYRLEESASLVKIREQLITSTGLNWTVGNVYVPLDRMFKLGYLATRIGEPTSQRGGKAVKFYILSPKGKKSLFELKKVYEKMWADLPKVAFEK
jgi:DNA-binding PadR family transcriptional regulator